MREWFLDTYDGKEYGPPQLWGASVKRFDDPYDLVALRVPADQDRLSEFILNYCSCFFPVRPSPSTTPLFTKRHILTPTYALGNLKRRPLLLHPRIHPSQSHRLHLLHPLRHPPLRLHSLPLLRAQRARAARHAGGLDGPLRRLHRLANEREARSDLCGDGGVLCGVGGVC